MNSMKLKGFIIATITMIQILSIAAFFHYCEVLGRQKGVFEEVKEFNAVEVKCVSIDKTDFNMRGRSALYTNEYQYVVDGETYTKILYAERTPGKNTVWYYNPKNPEIISRYKSYSHAKSENFKWVILASLGQAIVVIYVLRKINKGKVIEIKKKPKKVVGYVVEDEYDFLNEKP